ncbi:MAG: hypothetical protein WCC25_24730, partial [Candidatus Korobacteraceae bacterium]
TGRMVIALPAGRSDVDVRFVRTPDRWIGDGVSLAAIILLGGFWYVKRKVGSVDFLAVTSNRRVGG